MSWRDLLRYLSDFGVRDVSVVREGAPQPADAAPEGADGAAGGLDPLAAADLGEEARRLADCRRCRLCEGRKQVVFGVGNPRARVVFVGEAPGADEDRIGEPFVGRAGQLLNAMLRAMGMAREDVYIANICKCRPPGNRDPQDDEAAMCLPFLRRQVELIDPTVIVTLGRIAARHLTGTTAPISSYRGRWLKWEGRDVLPTFHPAYLLRSPSMKAQAWEDLKKLKSRLGV